MTSKAVRRLIGERTALMREREHRTRVFAPPPRLTITGWADRFRVLPPESPEPGRWRTARAPYLREIMDACCDPKVERVVVMKSSQVGYTELLLNIIGYHIDQQPSSMLLIQPTVDDAKDWSKERLDPMLHHTRRLNGRVKESGRRDSKNTLRMKIFDGGFLASTGSNSAAGLRRRAVRVLLADEVDGYGFSAKGSSGKRFEGDPLSLAIKRTENFRPRKIVEGSTPTDKGTSRIELDFALSDQRFWFVPCPHCGHMQTLKWKNFIWDERDATTVRYLCGEISENGELTAGCGKAILEHQKRRMVEAGEWRAQRPGRPVRGYFIWAAYSLLSKDGWEGMVKQWLEAQGNTLQLQVFVNTVLGETWVERGRGVSPDSLAARRKNYGENFEVPAGVAVLTAGVDVQGDRLEVSVWGWGPGEQRWLIRHEKLWGDPGASDVWAQLDAVLFQDWRHELGIKLKIRRAAVDSGGHHTDEVYRYCQARRAKGVYAIRGSSLPGKVAVAKPSKAKGALLWILGTVALKDALFSALEVSAIGPRYVNFCFQEEEYFKQLTGETVKTVYVQKKPHRKYIQVHERVEALDCAVYAAAALHMLGPLRDQLDKVLAMLKAKAEGAAPPDNLRRRRTLHPGVE